VVASAWYSFFYAFCFLAVCFLRFVVSIACLGCACLCCVVLLVVVRLYFYSPIHCAWVNMRPCALCEPRGSRRTPHFRGLRCCCGLRCCFCLLALRTDWVSSGFLGTS
jgi:hypothetical protein